MKTKKCGICAAWTAVLLMTALLITGCMEPVDFSGFGGGTTGTGSGSLTIRIIDPNMKAKTVMPTLGTVTYDLLFEDNDTLNPEPTLDFDDYQGEDITTLIAGVSYKLTVTAKSGSVTYATAEVASVTSVDGAVIVNLVAETTGNGTFAYDFSSALPTNFVSGVTDDSAVLSFFQLEAGAAQGPINIDVGGTAAHGGSIALTKGEYRVSLTLTKADHALTVHSEVVHIYTGLTSTWAPAQFPPIVNLTHLVTFNLNSATGAFAAADPSGNQTHGTVLTEPGTPTNSNGEQFDGWYTKNGSGNDWGIPWGFLTNAYELKVISNLTLFAKWYTPDAFSVTINALSFTDQAPVVALATMDVDQAEIIEAEMAGEDYTITINLSNYDIFDTIRWLYGGNVISTGDSLVLDLTDPPVGAENLSAPGQQRVYIEGVIGSTTYSAFVVIDVTAFAP